VFQRFAFIAAFAAIAFACGPASAKPLRNGGKLLLTNGISSLDGAAGGGLTPWAVIAGNETKNGVGIAAHLTRVPVKSYDYGDVGLAVGFRDRVELSYTHQSFDTNKVGGLLGLGNNYKFTQDVFGAKLRVAGDLVYDAIPAIAIGAQYKKSNNDAIVRVLGARHAAGIDYYATASKLFLSRSILISATARLTKANQMGLLGFGGTTKAGATLQFEGSAAWQLSRRLAIGGEYRRKPNNLKVAREDDWYDLFAAFAITRNLTATLAYADLGSVATVKGQRGTFLQLQAAF
jgi:hypothetical protein